MNLMTQVTQKNKDMQTISVCEYPLQSYMDMISMDLKRIITDIEDMVYASNGNLPKEEWNSEVLYEFNKIKHKLLDKAGEIGRLPGNIFDADQTNNSVSSFWGKVFNSKEADG